jgi:hypothetical protein
VPLNKAHGSTEPRVADLDAEDDRPDLGPAELKADQVDLRDGAPGLVLVWNRAYFLPTLHLLLCVI